MTYDGWMTSDGKSQHGLWPGELKHGIVFMDIIGLSI